MSFSSPVYVVFGGPHNLPQIQNSFPAISMAAKTCCENAVFLTSFAAIEIAGKLLGIWGRLWGPPKTAYTGLQKDTLTSLISPMVWLHDPCKEKCL